MDIFFNTGYGKLTGAASRNGIVFLLNDTPIYNFAKDDIDSLAYMILSCKFRLTHVFP